MVRPEIPRIPQAHGVSRVTLWAFDLDGWCPRRLGDAELPVLQVASRPDDPVASEWERFENFREALQT